MTTPPPPPPEERLALLERQLSELAMEVAAIRSELRPPGSLTGAPPVAHKVPPRRTRSDIPRRAVTSQEIERLMGRYGMLIIAVLAAVAAVGTFLSWAISRGYLILSPSARVLAGIAFGAAIGAWGLRLRRRERSFGSSMLGLGLVIELVCAYAAGPAFHLVPAWVALAGAAAVSWSLALFALSDGDEPLWCVAFGGAALAPFATSDGNGSVFALVAYAAVLLFSACFAIGRREWPVAWRVFYAVSALLVIGAATQAGTQGTPGFLAVFALPWAIAVSAVIPFVPHSRKRGVLRWLASLAVLATFAENSPASGDAPLIGGALLGAAALWLVIVDRLTNVPQSSVLTRGREYPQVLDWIDGAAIALILIYRATAPLSATVDVAAIYAVAAFAFALFAWRRVVSPLRDAAAFAAVALLVAVVESLALPLPIQRVAAYTALGLASLAAHRARPSRSWLGMGLGVLVLAAALSTTALVDRPAYRFTPFATEASATALIVTVALILIAGFWHWLRTATRTAMGIRPEWTYAGWLRILVRAVTLAPWVWAFVWALIELSMAFSPSSSTLLLVTYFAASAVGCVAAGRARRSARLRQVGLALAVVAAMTAIYGASRYFDFAARIAAYLVTSAFLLGIAYWYRRPGGTPATAA